MRRHVVERCLTALLVLEVKRLREMGEPLVNPRTGRRKGSMGKLMCDSQACPYRIRTHQAREQQGAALKGRVIRIVKVRDLHLLAGCSEPIRDERHHRLTRSGVRLCRHRMSREIVDYDGRAFNHSVMSQSERRCRMCHVSDNALGSGELRFALQGYGVQSFPTAYHDALIGIIIVV